MKHSKIITVFAMTALFGAGCVGVTSRTYTAPESPARSAPTAPPAAPAASAPAKSSKTVTVIMVAGGFSPSQLTIAVGDTVKFINQDTVARWPASGMHPTHLLCPGFDALRGLSPGESYSFTFREAKTCPFHDHLNPSLFGKITVQ